MRIAIIAAVALSACWSEPTGRAQLWPPPRGMIVESVASADLDGDGAPEVIVMSSGDEHQAGMYLVKGDTDLALGTASPVTSFTTYTHLALSHPAAIAVVPAAGAPNVVAVYTDPFWGLEVFVYDNALAEITDFTATLEPNSALLWARPIASDSTMPDVIASNGISVHLFDADGNDHPVPSPTMQAWATAEVATSFGSASARSVAVATPSQIAVSPLPAGSSTEFTWTIVRDGAAWVGQTALDLGAGHETIVGLDLAAGQLCAVDPASPSPVCIALPGASANTEVSMLLVPAPPGQDLVITQANATSTDVSVIAGITAGLSGTPSTRPSVPIPHGRPVVVNAGAGTPARVLVFGADGRVECGAGAC